MSQTNPETLAVQTPVIPDPEVSQPLWQRLGSGLLLFSLIFSGLLFASWTYVLPRLTAVKLQGKTVDLAVIIPYEQKLRAQIADAEGKRNKIVLPVKDDDFAYLKNKTRCYPMLEELRAQIAEAATGIGDDAVVFSGMALDADGTLTLTGDVRNVGPRSMTILAQLVETLKSLPFTESATAPVFTRLNDPLIGFHSPFSFVLTLKPSELCPSSDQ